MLAVAATLVAGLVGGAVVGLAVRDEQNARRELPAVVPSALIDADGRGHQATDQPVGALLEVWSSAQWGDVPRILRLHDPPVRQALGDAVLAGVYAHQRTRMTTRRPRVTEVEVRGRVATVRYRMQGESQPATGQLAILRRRGHLWFLRYDTFVEDALPFYVSAARGAGDEPQRADRAAAARTAAAYRDQAARLAALTR
jgi:hypothetical protein